ncbi:MAG: hypothetical protein IKB50_01805 [Clostridia bacterium]|nr:hypothetical protein [Clostridia bacterium]
MRQDGRFVAYPKGGTPRIANLLLRRVRDFAQVSRSNIIRTRLKRRNFRGGPVGLDTLAATIGEDATTIEDVYEPYLLQLGFINRTPKGRVVSKLAYEHFNIPFEK